MYLSRIRLDTTKRDTIKFLTWPHALHAAVEQCFPWEIKNQDRTRKLWRVDTLVSQRHLLLLSQEKPDFSKIQKKYGFHDERGESKSYLPLLKYIEIGQEWRFKLRANPTHSSSKEKGRSDKRGKVYSHVTVDQQVQWLLKRSASCGFKLSNPDEFGEKLTFLVTKTEHLTFKRGESPVTLGIATFEGTLRVTDIERFKTTLLSGIGRAKAYGCGLLTLVKP